MSRSAKKLSTPRRNPSRNQFRNHLCRQRLLIKVNHLLSSDKIRFFNSRSNWRVANKFSGHLLNHHQWSATLVNLRQSHPIRTQPINLKFIKRPARPRNSCHVMVEHWFIQRIISLLPPITIQFQLFTHLQPAINNQWRHHPLNRFLNMFPQNHTNRMATISLRKLIYHHFVPGYLRRMTVR